MDMFWGVVSIAVIWYLLSEFIHYEEGKKHMQQNQTPKRGTYQSICDREGHDVKHVQLDVIQPCLEEGFMAVRKTVAREECSRSWCKHATNWEQVKDTPTVKVKGLDLDPQEYKTFIMDKQLPLGDKPEQIIAEEEEKSAGT